VRALLRFATEDLSRKYIRAVRRRFWDEKRTPKKIAAYAATHYVLTRYLTVLSVFAPHIAEYLYQRIRSPSMSESVCLTRWPKVEEHRIDPDLEDAMEVADDVISSSLAARQKAGYKLRWPVARLIISPKSARAKDAVIRLLDYIARMTNSLRVEVLDVGQEPREAVKDLEPVLRSLGPAAGKRLNEVISALRSLRPMEVIESLESEGEYVLRLPDGTLFTLTQEHVQVVTRLPEWLREHEGRFARVYVDLKEDESVKALSAVNEVIRRVQVLRKELNLEVTELVDCRVYVDDSGWVEALKTLSEHFEEETRSRLEILGAPPRPEENDAVREWEVGGKRLVVGLKRTVGRGS
ncbi:MAG: class I tRNA ligase family protein, partial [Nitrososphaerota archaeon]